MTATRQRWQQEFANAADAIPCEWLVTIDGQQWITHERVAEPIVQYYKQLVLVGFARGWMPVEWETS